MSFTFPIIALTTLAGYFFSKGGKNSRGEDVRQHVEASEKPSGSNIYTSNTVQEANRELLARSAKNYVLAESPAETGVLPQLFNTYGSVGNDSVLAAEIQNVSATQQMVDVNNLNRYVDVLQPQINEDVANRPMFRSTVSSTVGSTAVAEFGMMNEDKPVSMLTGLALDSTHNNMVPFFGSSAKQNIEGFTNEGLLDKHTGSRPHFQHKKEVATMFQPVQQNIHGTPVFGDEVAYDRYLPSSYRQNEKPFLDMKVAAPKAGTAENNIRPVFKDVNELRPGNRPKETHGGRTIAGQRGEVRGVQNVVNRNRPDTFYQKTKEHLFKTTGEFLAPQTFQNFQTNFRPTSREDYTAEYYGGASANREGDRQRVSLQTVGTDALAQQPKRNNFENDYTRNIGGQTHVNDYGKNGIDIQETERATTGKEVHALNVHSGSQGLRLKNTDAPRQTIKETTLKFDSSGNVKTGFDTGLSGAYHGGVADVTAKTTHKQTTVNNNYKGIMNKGDGMGYLVNKYEAKTTNKEMTSQNDYVGAAGNNVKSTKIYSTYEKPEKVRNAVHVHYRGNAGFSTETTSRQNFANAEIRDAKEILESGARPSGPQNFQIQSGKASFGDIKVSQNTVLKGMRDGREFIHSLQQQAIPNKDIVGVQSKVRYDDERVDTAYTPRMEPHLIAEQHAQNPYSIFGKN